MESDWNGDAKWCAVAAAEAPDAIESKNLMNTDTKRQYSGHMTQQTRDDHRPRPHDDDDDDDNKINEFYEFFCVCAQTLMSSGSHNKITLLN